MLKTRLLYILFFNFLLFAQTEEETLVWDAQRPLIWQDFKGEPKEKPFTAATTSSGISFSYSISTYRNKNVGFDAKVIAHFYPNKSWYIKERCNDYLLSHEQLHFDITELYARKFRKEILKLIPNPALKSQLHELNSKINKELRLMQKQYDKDTDHSLIREEQLKWENKIAQALIELEAFKLK